MEKARTWMIATLGPASSDPGTVKALFEAGVDIFRVNLSHGSRAEHREFIRLAAAAGGEVMVDLPGPKVRVDGASSGLPMEVREGDEVFFASPERGSSEKALPVLFIEAPVAWGDIPPGSRILVDDGNVEFSVLESGDGRARARAVSEGVVKMRKGVAFDRDVVKTPPVVAEDLQALDELSGEPFRYVAVSFARVPECVSGLRNAVGDTRRLIAKIEDPSGVRNVEAILEVSDGLMVARGDLGVCTPLPALPVLQKRLVALANYYRKPVIVATQVLESMVEHSRPTRAEVTDAANAVFDGADMLMLSAETAVGRHPVKAVEVLASIIAEAEKAVRTGLKFQL